MSKVIDYYSQLIVNGNYKKAIKELTLELRNECNPLFYSLLSEAYCYQSDYKKSLEASCKAYQLTKNHPMILWYYAKALFVNNKINEAKLIYRKILNKKPYVISDKMGWQKNKELKALDMHNSCRYKIAQCYLHANKLSIALQWLEKCMDNRILGIQTQIPFSLVKNIYSKTLRLKNKIDQQKPRRWKCFLEIRSTQARKHKNAFVNVIAWAKTKEEIPQKIIEKLKQFNYELVEIDSIEEFDLFILINKISKELQCLGEKVAKTKAVELGTFYTYP